MLFAGMFDGAIVERRKCALSPTFSRTFPLTQVMVMCRSTPHSGSAEQLMEETAQAIDACHVFVCCLSQVGSRSLSL
jgi:hypothetical protein